MESPLPCRVQKQVEHDDENRYVFEDRSMMVRTPPPSYHYAVSTSQKNDDPWLARMSSLDETVLEMRRAVENTQYMMKDIQNKYQKSSDEILHQPSSLSKKRLRTSKSFSSSSYSSSDDAITINNNENDIKNSLTPIAIDNGIDSENNDDVEGQDEQEENNSDDLDRITRSLQQLIEQAQSSLQSKLAIRDRSYGSMLHRSNSCPQISTVFNPAKERRQSDTDTPSTPQIFDWNGQRERFFDSESKLTQAMHELAIVCCQDNLNNSNNNTFNNNSGLSFLQLPSSISSVPSIVASSSSLQPENIIVQHHYHEHHHHHYYHNQEQNQEQEKQHHHHQHQHQMGQILNYAWSSLRAISSNSTAVAAEAAARSSARLLNNINMLNQQLIVNHISKPLHIHPPKINLTKANLLRLMVYITLLIFSFMNQQQQQQQNLSKKCITARRCIGQFVSHASDNLPISTWIQHSTLLVYITAFL